MKNAPMRFCGMSLHHNPAKLTVQNTANIRRLIVPDTPPDTEHLGIGLWIVKGDGELYGADCMEQYRKLRELYMREQKGVLILSGLPVMTAYLSELELIAETVDDVVTYHFTFTQAQGGGSTVSADGWYTASAGDSLWDIAYRCGVSIDMLVRLNPNISQLDALNAGKRVRIC